ncbi:MAG: hypothetical protein ABI461_06755, partial [Polyangiaceae bacterium]
GLAFSFARQRSKVADLPQIQAPIASAVAAPAPAPVGLAGANRMAKLRIDTDPPGASVREDGAEVCTATPCVMTYEGEEAAPDAIHTFAVAHAGFLLASISAKASDAKVSIALVPVTTAASAVRAHAPAPAASAGTIATSSAAEVERGVAADPAPSSSTDAFKDLPY